MNAPVPADRIKTAVDEAANALQTALLLASELPAEHADLLRAIERACAALARLKPSGESDEGKDPGR